MGFADLEFSQIVRRLSPLRAEWTDHVVPEAVELLPNHPYTPEYAWMYAYEKQLRNRIETALKYPLRSWERVLFGTDGVLSEGLSNAYVHGHRRDASAALTIRAAVSLKGLGFAIGDRGPGFDYHTLLDKAERGSGGFFHYAGNGLRTLIANPAVSFSWTDGGRSLNLLLEFT